MGEADGVGGVSYFFEPVEVELADEGVEVVVAEVLGHYLVLES